MGFVTRMQTLLGSDYEAFARCFDEKRVQGLRFNTLKAPLEEELESVSAKFSLTKVPWCNEGFYYEEDDRPGKHPFHDAGVYYIQEPSAMAVCELLNPEPSDFVLDLCAAPGGKSTQIAAKLKNSGLLIANEINTARAKVLSQNIERMGITDCVVTNEESAALAKRFPGFFDKILVDAPCSGEGMFRKDEEALAQWSEENVALCAKRDQDILNEAAKMLKPGGSLVYSTCTFEPEEDENAVETFLKSHPDFSDEPECVYRLWPHKVKGEGHFMALLKKSEDSNKDPFPIRNKRRLNPSFLKDREIISCVNKGLGSVLKDDCSLFETVHERLVLYGDEVYALPQGCPSLDGLKVLRPGLHLGSIKKNRFEPSHALALTLMPKDCQMVLSLPSDGDKIKRYLKGDTLPIGADKKGWVLICADEYSIGWGKAVNGTLKNHYPKGLRVLA